MIPNNMEKQIPITKSFIKRSNYQDEGAKLLINSRTNNMEGKKATTIKHFVKKRSCPAVMI